MTDALVTGRRGDAPEVAIDINSTTRTVTLTIVRRLEVRPVVVQLGFDTWKEVGVGITQEEIRIERERRGAPGLYLPRGTNGDTAGHVAEPGPGPTHQDEPPAAQREAGAGPVDG